MRDALLSWFDVHKRDLPWRRTRDPYAIWVSEVMLQQTRVAAVLDHYARWMKRFPAVEALGSADESEVLALWSGLGYYRRARFLHAGARAVVSEHEGKLPPSADGLRKLPGIGEYTAAAIASIAFDEPVAVVDGNVERVIQRLGGLSSDQPTAQLARTIRMVANELLAPGRAGDWNQAMMELGATLCLPRAPLCLQCPVQGWCATRGEHAAAPRKTMRSQSIAHGLVRRSGRDGLEVLLAQRPAQASLMPGMWELPEIAATPGAPLLTLRHAITVTNYTVSIVEVGEREGEALTGSRCTCWVPLTSLPEIALTGLARKALQRLALWPEPARRE